MIAIDYAWNLGPDYRVPEADRGKLDLMLRSSDDAAASEFWSRNGGAAIVERMVTRLHLRDSAPPPVGRGWGSTAVSAEDMVRIYRYLLDRAPAPVRDLVMGNLHRRPDAAPTASTRASASRPHSRVSGRTSRAG